MLEVLEAPFLPGKKIQGKRERIDGIVLCASIESACV
jgi:hypothetical protein